MKEYKYLILAHPRSGTGYMANLFKLNGLDVGHEYMGKDGTSNWQFAVCAEKYPYDVDGIRRQDVSFETVIHVIRKPIDAINSIAFTEERSEAFRAEYVPIIGNVFERAVLSYYGWNRLIAAQQPHKTIKLETAQQDLGFENGSDIVNARPHDVLGEEQLLNNISHEVLWYYNKLKEWHSNL